MTDIVFTIGHSNHPIEKLIDLLAAHSVTAVADVRSSPYSRFNPQFNRDALLRSLRKRGIDYVSMGLQLGARPRDQSVVVEGRVSYDFLAKTEDFQLGLTRIVDGSRSNRIALLCAEKDPIACHRGILIARHLTLLGCPVRHILDTGESETHEQALDRLLSELRFDEGDLFRSREERIVEAYGLRGRAIAYTGQAESANDNEWDLSL